MKKTKPELDPVHNITWNLKILIDSWSNQIKHLQVNQNLKDLCVALYYLGENYDAIDELLKQLSLLYEQMNKEVLPEAFEKAGIDKIAIPELSRSFYPSTQYSASFVNEAASLKWLKENNLEGIIKETVNRNTLAATLKGRLLEENLEPPDCMKLSKYTIIDSRKYTPKDK